MALANYVTDYDPSEIQVNFGGAQLGGFEPGTFCSIIKTKDTWSGKSGIGGEYVFIKSNDHESIVTITLMSNSDSNDYLSGVYQADATLSGVGLLPLVINNNLGRELFICTAARLMKIADVNFSDNAEPKQWRFLCYNAQFWAGGHSVLI